MAKVPNGMETLPTISTGWVGCTNVTDRRQKTDGRVTANSEQECEFTFAKTVPNCNVSFANGEFHQAYGQFHETICLMNNCERNVAISYSFCAWLCNTDIVIAVSSTWWTFTLTNPHAYYTAPYYGSGVAIMHTMCRVYSVNSRMKLLTCTLHSNYYIYVQPQLSTNEPNCTINIQSQSPVDTQLQPHYIYVYKKAAKFQDKLRQCGIQEIINNMTNFMILLKLPILYAIN